MLRAYGDCVISCGLLARLPASADVTIVGTRLTQKVAEILEFDRFPIRPVLDDVAALFDLKRAGPLRALADVRSVRRALREQLRPGDRLLLEHRDWRNVALRPARVAAFAPRRGSSIYADRLELLRQLFGDMPPWRLCRKPADPIRTLAVHPGAREPFKRIPPRTVRRIVEHASRRGMAVSLLDPEGHHVDLAARVQCYLPRTSIEEAVSALRSSDMLVGADSFFLHLAYHFDRPLLALVPRPDPYFTPPGLAAAGGVLTLTEAAQPDRLERALDAMWTRADG